MKQWGHFHWWYMTAGLIAAFAGCQAQVDKHIQPMPKSTTQATTRSSEPVLQLKQFPLTDSTVDLLPFVGPRYSVTVHADGRVLFDGSYLVKTLGTASHVLSESEFREFREDVQSLQLETIKSSGQHAHYAVLAVARGTGLQEIHFDRSNVERYVQARKRLEKYLRTMEYRCPVKDIPPEIAAVNPDLCADIFELPALARGVSKPLQRLDGLLHA